MAIPAEEKIGLTGFLKIQEQLTSQENTTYILNTPWQNEKWKAWKMYKEARQLDPTPQFWWRKLGDAKFNADRACPVHLL